MAEQELLDLFIQERVNMLLAKLSKTRSGKSAEEQERILQAEHIDNLPEKERKLVKNYRTIHGLACRGRTLSLSTRFSWMGSGF